MKKRYQSKDNFTVYKSIRREWRINPVTRVKGNELKSKKKIRDEGKKQIIEYKKGRENDPFYTQ